MATVASEPLTELERIYLTMERIRAFEAKAMELFAEKYIRGSVHPYSGQEAIAVGVCSALADGDFITSTHRGHGHCIAKGLELRPMMAEITGRATGYCRGRGGSMHITAMRHGMLGADAIVAGSLAIAVGAAYGLRLQGKDAVVVAFFGDGGAQQGIFHEAANLASVLDAPVVFVCENNQWAISTPISCAIKIEDIAARAAGYGFPGEVVDGNDVLAMQAVSRDAIDRARRGDGPTLIEAKTYRITPHSAATPQDTRDPEELAYWRERDPIVRFASDLCATGQATKARLDELARQARDDVEDAATWALESPYPDAAAAEEDVYAPADWLVPGRLA